MGIISPVGQTVETFWENVTAGRHGIAPISFFDTTDFKAKLAAEVKDFNPRQYMEKADILRSDRYAQLGLCAAVQAVEQSGVIGTLAPERIGVYFGTGIGGIHTMMTEHDKLLARGPRRVSAYFVPMLIANMCAGTIAIRYGCKGAALPAVTACASGSNAIGEAVRAIRHGYADAIISGGTESPLIPMAIAGFANARTLSPSDDPDYASLPFSADREGFVIAEGAGILVLEDMEQIPVCVAYEVDGERTDIFPSGEALAKAKPIYEYLPGFGGKVAGVTRFEDLPKNAQDYVRYLEKAVDCPIQYVSTGADRESYIKMF